MTTYIGTYSPDDNKLRLYASSRLDAELYARVKAAGFKWAPKQDLFVAPMWTPDRADLLIELCGEINDEDTSLVDRAEERSDRFEDYSDKRAEDANRAHKVVESITDGIPFGQPILIGHHSEKRARKDAQRIENGMRKAVNMWETSQYWKSRAAGALRNAKYKELPGVRARRIKGIEADKRKQERTIAEANNFLKAYRDPKALDVKLNDGRALLPTLLAGWGGGLTYEDQRAFEKEEISFSEALAKATTSKANTIAWATRWIEHYDNRLTYERAMLDEQGGSDLLKPKARHALLPLLNYRAPDGVSIKNMYRRDEVNNYPQIDMTKAEYSAIYEGYKGVRIVDNSHRVRTVMQKHSLYSVFLTDSKEHQKPEKAQPETPKHEVAPELVEQPEQEAPQITSKPLNADEQHNLFSVDPEAELREIWTTQGVSEEKQNALIAGIGAKAQPGAQVGPFTLPEDKPTAETFKAMREQLKQGVQVVSTPQLFPTPMALAQKMVDLADIQPGQRVLEPSAGTGRILGAMGGRMFGQDIERGIVHAVEINRNLSERLRADFPLTTVHFADFLTLTVETLGRFDKIIMNPPFINGQDIAHIKHAAGFLNPRGKLVAICANGPRQNEQLEQLADTWEVLPAGTFTESGTGVNTVLLTING